MSAGSSTRSIWAFWSLPAKSQFIDCQRVNWSSTQMPDWREPLPDLPLPPKGRCASAPEVELLTETMPAEMRPRERNPCPPERVESTQVGPEPRAIASSVASSEEEQRATPPRGADLPRG